MRNEVPKGWVNASIFEISSPKQWKTIPLRELTEDGYPVYGANGLIGKYGSYTHEFPTLMITCRGASCGNIHKSVSKSYINGNAMALDDLSPLISMNFLKHQLELVDYTNIISGSAQPQITKEGLKGLNLLVAPLEEQHRIAKKLDILLFKVEAAQARLDKVPTLLKRFRQSVLNAATSGKLTEEWRKVNDSQVSSDEVATLEIIKNGLIDQKLVKKDLFFTFSNVLDKPSTWSEVTLGSLGSKITDGEHKTPKREKEGHFLLSARNVRDGFLSFDKVDYVGEDEFVKLRKRCDPNKGDILISCSGSVGRVALCDKSDAYVMVRSAALVKTDLMKQNNKFLMYVLQSPKLQKVIVDTSKSTAQSNLFLGPIKSLPIPYPPSIEQAEIVSRIETLFALADEVDKKYKQAKLRIDRLTPAILAKAFSGNLVPQDSNDEPASKLLERIGEARA